MTGWHDWENSIHWLDDQLANKGEEWLVKAIEKLLEYLNEGEVEDAFGKQMEADGYYIDREEEYLDYKMTHPDAVETFNEEIKPLVEKHRGYDDDIALREEWNNWTDSLCKGGVITNCQYENWDNPF